MELIENLSQIELNTEGLIIEGKPQDVGKNNIIIGKNGAGKSRLLRALKNHYNEQVVYCDFTKLQSAYDEIHGDSYEAEETLYDHGRRHKVYYSNEILEIQYDADEYLERIFSKTKGRQEKLYSEGAVLHFRKYIKDILGYEVSVDKKDVIFEKGGRKNPLDITLREFSPGELFVFYLIIFETLHQDEIEKSILILDEPECHLHAAALREFIRYIKESTVFEQIWIATHSLYVLPEFEFEDIIYLKDSRIMPKNGRLYECILDDVLGTDDDRNISGFFSSLSEWMYAQFIEECFTEPATIDAVNPEDPQVKAFFELIGSREEKKQKYKILDFGGGKERLRKCLEAGEKIDKFEYSICDPQCELESDTKVQRYKNIQDINETYDYIVAMNVFHEIDLSAWPHIFKKMKKILNAQGSLIFIERKPLSKGESPDGQYGYFVFGKAELQKLFNTENISEIENSKKIVAAIISRDNLNSVTDESIREAVLQLKKTSWEFINKQLSEEIDDKSKARAYAFYVQQYVNTIRFLTNYEKNTSERGGINIDYQLIIDARLNENGITYLKWILTPHSKNEGREYFSEKMLKIHGNNKNSRIVNYLITKLHTPNFDLIEFNEEAWELIIKDLQVHTMHERLYILGALSLILTSNSQKSLIEILHAYHLVDKNFCHESNRVGRDFIDSEPSITK